MSNLMYMKLEGPNQGLISAGCGSKASICNKYQINHIDEIFLYGIQHIMTREQNVNHQALTIIKPIDKSTPLLCKSINTNEELTCDIYFYRICDTGRAEKYFNIRLGNATIASIQCDYPHNMESNERLPQEIIAIKYQNITWKNIACATESYSILEDRIF